LFCTVEILLNIKKKKTEIIQKKKMKKRLKKKWKGTERDLRSGREGYAGRG
jgi:hypothetical protein